MVPQRRLGGPRGPVAMPVATCPGSRASSPSPSRR
ncbi:hypothetical protein Ae406Ps2_3775 [Pseudonocardia sp. Ae406_Ps2]|nr:hypothetical protein Ae406Ps2_3775 [Pseudonocardia sp. Ae406_Ps2]OLM11370.1 hypothetical protein Ae505Ps2_1494c [Pseudonocardia sp. Ae505_Ps2]